MQFKITLRWLLYAAVAATLLAGCGSESPSGKAQAPTVTVDSSYARLLREVDDSLDTAMQGLFADQQMTTGEIVAARDALNYASRTLRKANVPADVQPYHQMYVEGVEGFGPIIDKLAAARGNAEQIKHHLADPQYARVISNLERAQSGFEKAGYEL